MVLSLYLPISVWDLYNLFLHRLDLVWTPNLRSDRIHLMIYGIIVVLIHCEIGVGRGRERNKGRVTLLIG